MIRKRTIKKDIYIFKKDDIRYENVPKFVKSLHQLCMDPVYQDIIVFCENGFYIKNKDLFLETFEHTFFTNFVSFTRQLSFYHFKKSTKIMNNNQLIYINKYFNTSFYDLQYVKRTYIKDHFIQMKEKRSIDLENISFIQDDINAVFSLLYLKNSKI
jgi:hypothetical protein